MKAICRSHYRMKSLNKDCNYTLRKNASTSTEFDRTFSGIQPTGSIHLGNYLGAVKSWVDGIAQCSLETRDKNLFSIVNLHAITLPQNPSTLDENTYSMAASLIACGLQPEKVCILPHLSSESINFQIK